MASQRLLDFIEEQLAARAPWLKTIEQPLEAALRLCDSEEGTLLRYYYATMPLCDVADYTPELLMDYARHAMMLRREIPWCKALPEETFLHHVAYYRINSERIEPCRGALFSLLSPRIEGKSMGEAVLEVNYWCGENVRYTASDMRTAPPMAVLRAGLGRCGEESTFAVSVLRSVGIPARQVYTPRWAHCDDNHAWVEVQVDGVWHFFGACEPEEVLDRGWFNAAAARALVIHSRAFGGYPDYNEEKLSQEGLISFYNSTAHYTDTKTLTITVAGADGKPASQAEVTLSIFNMAELAPVVNMKTDQSGRVQVELGKGQVLAMARQNDCFGAILLAPDATAATITLCYHNLPEAQEAALAGTIDFLAPPALPGRGATLTQAQKQQSARRKKETAALYEARQQSFFDKELAKSFPEAKTLLQDSKGNFSEIYRFLSGEHWPLRLRLLKTLVLKDLRDATASLLETHLRAALPFLESVRLGKGQYGPLPDALFDSLILAPRIGFEELTDYRGPLVAAFSQEQKAAFTGDPAAVATYIEENFTYTQALDYPTLYTAPLGAMKVKDLSPRSRQVLFVAICRSLGIPARLNPSTALAEYYEGGVYLPGFPQKGEEGSGSVALTLTSDTPQDLVYRTTWALAMLLGGEFQTLSYPDIGFAQDGTLTLQLWPGCYRLITTTRMPNGNQKVDTVLFTLQAGEKAARQLTLHSGALSDYLMDNLLPDITLTDREGNTFQAAERFAGQNRVLLFLEEGGEPSEHVLNELLEKSAAGGVKFTPIFVVRDFSAMENKTLRRACEAIPQAPIYTFDFDSQLEPIGRQMFVDHEKLPLQLLTNRSFHGVFAQSGYRVGSVDLMEKLLAVLE